ncbi:hypothetical protein ACEPPN_000969 [Leptodophora sp. 'Broadleaf-Isolate-01']
MNLLLLIVSSLNILLHTASTLPTEQVSIFPDRDVLDISTKPIAYSGNNNLSVIEIDHLLYGHRDVSYFLTRDSIAIIDGDIIFGTEGELLAHQANQSAHDDIRGLAFSAPAPWPEATITWKFDSTTTEANLGAEVGVAIARWEVSAPFLNFRQIPNSPTSQSGVVTIRAVACDGCHADIGYANAPRTMNLQQGCIGNPGTCGPDQATHEFGHILGLRHEHQRPDRERYVHYSCQDLNPSCINGATMPPGSTCCSPVANCCGFASNFEIITDPFSDSSGIYDANSIMHYIENAFAIPGTETLISVNTAIVVPKNPPTNPSAVDFNRICKLYANWCPKAQECRSLGCPTFCSIRPPCHSPRCAGDPKFAPSCCDNGGDNADCRQQKRLCISNGCDFLR